MGTKGKHKGNTCFALGPIENAKKTQGLRVTFKKRVKIHILRENL